MTFQNAQEAAAFLDSYPATEDDLYVSITHFPTLLERLLASGIAPDRLVEIGQTLGSSDKHLYLDYNDLAAVYGAFQWRRTEEGDAFWRNAFGVTGAE